LVEARLYHKLCADLDRSGNVDYAGVAKARFQRLLVQMIRFCRTRTDALSVVYPYLRRLDGEEDRPHEKELQGDIEAFLIGQGNVDIERSDISSGRVDIYLPQPIRPTFRFIIEVKRICGKWDDGELGKFLNQTTAYQQADLRIGILAVLDLSDRPAGVPHFDQCLYLAEREISNADRRHAVVMRVPGNKRTPSDYRTPHGV
jgi:hypothetical protein